LESFQNGFQQVVENSCGYVDKLRFLSGFRKHFPYFLPKQGTGNEIFSVKSARNSGYPHFQTLFHRLLKTSPKIPHFPQRMQEPDIVSEFPRNKKTVSHKSCRKENSFGKSFGKNVFLLKSKNNAAFS